ncbi:MULTISPECIES: MarR family winged helix-turn-helix transcriptional regulator [Sphingobacterium]|uniref:MarR family winged helix-turn-helix transcriptional regulator n=1 Tax=Sphingobacterium TaxID=28453 RepID=UPI001042D790|nr:MULTISPECIES: MarR family winged helix-turn-helix transcriptional regulator [Sphingobacterium]MCW2263948.1 DNA-binding MarR family transcriptional regulator [Sphingobacterium kitahiroshimense]NJI73320.1 winged helix-turn-helix transcriptional regulator [Sphingobacterium sp. B16(2022)]TCR01698.1 DNA-binding MarR family transcriptional regulator [Sphingobacterium sp. JUb78]
MKYDMVKNVFTLLEQFELENALYIKYQSNIEGFKEWIAVNHNHGDKQNDLYWEGKENGRSASSVINTLIVHLNRYAKSYSKSAIFGSEFSTQEDFIYLINLKDFGEMIKMDLIKKNVHDKPAGMQIINRLITKGWVDQTNSEIDKRSKYLKINDKGLAVLEQQMEKIRQASEIVTGDLTDNEKMELIRLLNKLTEFHMPIYDKNIESEYLLTEVLKEKK